MSPARIRLTISRSIGSARWRRRQRAFRLRGKTKSDFRWTSRQRGASSDGQTRTKSSSRWTTAVAGANSIGHSQLKSLYFSRRLVQFQLDFSRWFAFSRNGPSRLDCGVDDGASAMRFVICSVAQRSISLKAKLGYCPAKSEAIRHFRKPGSIQFKEGARAPRPWEGNAPCAHC